MRVFSTAALVIGPHGGALANLLWMRDSAHVIEFVCGIRSQAVQDGCPWGRSYYWMLAGVSWIARYHLVPFTSNSTSAASFVKLDELSDALREAVSSIIVGREHLAAVAHSQGSSWTATNVSSSISLAIDGHDHLGSLGNHQWSTKRMISAGLLTKE